MTDIRYLIDIVENEEKKVVALIRDTTVNLAALKVAYYAAMIDAAEEDSLDDPDEQTAMLSHLNDEMKKRVEAFQDVVNSRL